MAENYPNHQDHPERRVTDHLERKITELSSQLGTVEVRFTSIENRFNTMDTRLSEHKVLHEVLKSHLERNIELFDRIVQKQELNQALIMGEIQSLKDVDLRNKTTAKIVSVVILSIWAGIVYAGKTAIDFILSGFNH